MTNILLGWTNKSEKVEKSEFNVKVCEKIRVWNYKNLRIM